MGAVVLERTDRRAGASRRLTLACGTIRMPKPRPSEQTNTQSIGLSPTSSIEGFGIVTCITSVTIRGRAASRTGAALGSSGARTGFITSAQRRSSATRTVTHVCGSMPDSFAISLGRPTRRCRFTRREMSIVLILTL